MRADMKWSVQEIEGSLCILEDGQVIAVMEREVRDGPQVEANARLMAAAPEMLQIVEDVSQQPYTGPGERARALLARVRGEERGT